MSPFRSTSIRNVVIVDACCAVVGLFGGSLRSLKADALARAIMTATLERTGSEPGQVDEIFLGHYRQFSDCPSTARYAALLAGIPETVPTSTVVCAYTSDILAVNCGFNAIRIEQDQIVLAGDTESMSNAISYLSNAHWGVGTGTAQLRDLLAETQFRSQPQDIYSRFDMGITTEDVTAKTGITREKQDRFALAPQERIRAAIATGRFKGEVVPPTTPQGRKKPDRIFDTDEFLWEISLKLLSRLKPAFLPPDSTVTAGNSSGRNDSASMLVLMDTQLAEEQRLKPPAQILDVAFAGVGPRYVGLGPVPATQKVLEMTDLRLGDIQLIELNGALAAQSISCIRELGFQDRMGIISVSDGAIILGHPVGSSGSRILVTLVREVNKRGLHYSLTTLRIAGGMGMTTVVETVQ